MGVADVFKKRIKFIGFYMYMFVYDIFIIHKMGNKSTLSHIYLSILLCVLFVMNIYDKNI